MVCKYIENAHAHKPCVSKRAFAQFAQSSAFLASNHFDCTRDCNSMNEAEQN